MRGRCWGRLSSRRSHLPSPVSMPVPCPGSPSELSPACSSAHPMDRGLRPYPVRPSAALLGFAQSLLSLTCSSSPHLSCFSCFLRSPAFCSRPPSPSFLLCPQLTAVPALPTVQRLHTARRERPGAAGVCAVQPQGWGQGHFGGYRCGWSWY